MSNQIDSLETIKEKFKIAEIQSVTIEIEDFLSFQEILIRSLEQLNMDNNTFNSKKSSLVSIEIIESNKDQIALNNLERRKTKEKIILKVMPELYKIRIGKKKTGLPNFDYPPINASNTIKNTNFTTLSIEYDEVHLDKNINEKDKSNNINDTKLEENFVVSTVKRNSLNEKLIGSGTINGEKDLNFSSETNYLDSRNSDVKKCCDKCLIF